MGTTDEQPRVRVYSYQKVWKIEKKIYSVQNITLPLPVNPYDFLEFLAVVLLMNLLNRFIPFLWQVPSVLKYLLLPFVIVRYLMKLKLDGKNPVRYMAGLVPWLLTRHGYTEHFQYKPAGRRRVKLRWICGRTEENKVHRG